MIQYGKAHTVVWAFSLQAGLINKNITVKERKCDSIPIDAMSVSYCAIQSTLISWSGLLLLVKVAELATWE
jgi:hypothetical protein